MSTFQTRCNEQFGNGAALAPENLIDSKRYEVKTTEVTISVDPEYSYLLETRVMDGKRYLMVPVKEGVEVNGMAVIV